MGRISIGLQLYTLREETAADFVGTLRKVAELGYEGVEFAGYGGMQPEELQTLLTELNLKAIGSHVGLDRLRNHLDEEIAMNKAIGSQYIICPYMPVELRNEDSWKEQMGFFAEIAGKLQEEGIHFAYHNHDFELRKKVGDELVFDALFAAAPSVKVEMDVCWVQVAGIDPLEYIKKYAGRLPLLHLKDMKRDGENVQTVILGEGEVDLKSVLNAAEAAGVEWLVVEQDHCQLPPLTSVAQSMDWLKQNYLHQ